MRDNNVSVLLGKTLTEIKNISNRELIFTTSEGEVYKMYHKQDCCECVRVEDICGDLDDLIGVQLVEAEEVSNSDSNRGEYGESCTWTFYKLRTSKGSVTIRWLGESNGYYSESVSFVKIEDKDNLYYV